MSGDVVQKRSTGLPSLGIFWLYATLLWQIFCAGGYYQGFCEAGGSVTCTGFTKANPDTSSGASNGQLQFAP